MMGLARSRDGQAGFTLVELLVVVVLMGIIGAAITNVVVTTLQTSRTNSDVRAKLDQTRLAVERVREEIRGADEVCTHSDGTEVAIWTDMNRDGLYQAGEVTRFLVADVSGQRILQRQDGTGTVRAIVGNVAPATSYFAYDLAPASQTPGVKCQPTTVAAGPVDARTSTVDVTIPITARLPNDPARADDMTVATSITLRNAVHGVVTTVVAGPAAANEPPVASFTSACSGLTCNFVSTSTDPDNDALTQRWDLGDDGENSTQSLQVSVSHTFPAAATYTVTLHVRDSKGAVHSTFQNVTLIVPAPDRMHISDLDDVSTVSTSGNSWVPAVDIEVRIAGGSTLSGATVTGALLLTGETRTCTTGSDGRCRIESATCVTIPGRPTSDSCPKTSFNTNFTVTNVAHPGYVYDAALNSDSDADNSDGTSIELVNPGGA
jgi:prepilin-type N-terminal cleavage/methylation domain-containing protein